MTTPTAPAKKTTEPKSPAKKAAAPAKKATPEFSPTVTEKGRLNHSTCGHPRTFAGRAACRAAQAKK